MSLNQKSKLISDDEPGDGLMYPWKKLNDLGYDNLWVDANKQSAPTILRRPSLVRHPSFENVVSSLESRKTSGQSAIATSELRKLSISSKVESSPSLIDEEKQKQDDYIAFKFGLHRFLIIPDGNCMYRALAQALAHNQNQHAVLRNELVSYIKENRDDFEPIIEESFDDFIKQASQNNTWGSYVELLAATKLLSINIVIVTGGCPSNPDVSVTCHHYDPNNDSITPKDTVWLSWLSNGHYDVILDSVVKNVHYDEWLAERSRQMESDAEMAERLSLDNTEDWQRSPPATKSSVASVKSNNTESDEYTTATACSSQTESAKPWTIEDDEQLARTLQEAEDVFAYYGLS